LFYFFYCKKFYIIYTTTIKAKLLKVELASLSTTLATNAIVENEGRNFGMTLSLKTLQLKN